MKEKDGMKRTRQNIWEQDFTWTPAYLSHLDVGVFYGVGVTFDELFHLPQMSLLDFLKLLLEHTQTKMVRQEKPLLYGAKTLVWGLRFKSYLLWGLVFFCISSSHHTLQTRPLFNKMEIAFEKEPRCSWAVSQLRRHRLARSLNLR